MWKSSIVDIAEGHKLYIKKTHHLFGDDFPHSWEVLERITRECGVANCIFYSLNIQYILTSVGRLIMMMFVALFDSEFINRSCFVFLVFGVISIFSKF